MERLALEELQQQLPADVLVTNPATIESYRWDRANDPEAGTPLVVVRPTSTEQVQQIVTIAAKYRIALVPRGAGTSLSGGSTAVDNGIVLSLERMNSIEVHPQTRSVTAGPGALNAEVKAAAAEHGLWYPPDPSSFEICSIGGNVATNAGGLCCVKYGVTTDYVLGMTVVLADGKIITLGGPCIKDVAGLSLTKLFVGSEGTLGVITEVHLRLIPRQKQPTTMVATFPSLESATQAVQQITQTMRPSMLEFMDHATIQAVNAATGMGLDDQAAALLIAQSDESTASAVEEIQRMEAICTEQGATEAFCTDDPEEGEAFVTARRVAIPSIERMGAVLLEDVGVPLPKLSELVVGINQIATRHQVSIPTMAHAGDGNTHPLVVLDPTDPEQQARAHQAYGEIMDLAIGLGGTITGEHGVGRLKRPWLQDYLGEDIMELNQRIKDALDPLGIMNPGAIFDATDKEN